MEFNQGKEMASSPFLPCFYCFYQDRHCNDMQLLNIMRKQLFAVFSAFLDASKAFDRTNHNLLFAKLIKRNVPMCIVRLLLCWYRQQTMKVKWGTNYSSPFTTTNGVKQGGVLIHTYLLFTWMNSQSSWDQPGWDALWEIWL